MSNTVLRRAVNGLVGTCGGKRTQNVFSPFASNRCRPPASGGFVATQSASGHTPQPELRETPRAEPNVRGKTVSGTRTRIVFSPFASNPIVFRRSASDGIFKFRSPAYFAQPDRQGTPSSHRFFKSLLNASKLTSAPKYLVGINGFKSLGKCLLRLALNNYIDVAAINEPSTDLQSMVRSLREDPLHLWDFENVKIEGDNLRVNGNLIRVCHEKNPENINWSEMDAEYIIDSTENCADLATAMKHISPGGAKKVITTSPSMDVPRFFLRMNYGDYRKNMSVVSIGSSAANSAVPIICVMKTKYIILKCLVTSACCLMSGRPMDAGSTTKNIMLRRKYLMFDAGAMPELHREVAMNLAYMNLHFWLNENANVDDILALIYQSVYSSHNVITTYKNLNEPDQIEFLKNMHSAIINVKQIIIHKNYVIIGVWYNRTMGFASRALDLTKYIMTVDKFHQT